MFFQLEQILKPSPTAAPVEQSPAADPYQTLSELFDANLWLERIIAFMPYLFAAIVIFAVFYILSRIVTSVLERATAAAHMDSTARGFLISGIKYALLIFGLLTALRQVGLDLTSVIAGLGIVGLSLGFAAKDVLSNIVAGLFLFWDKPFVTGDLVEINNEYGEVRQITFRTTRLITPQGKMVSIPNSVMINSTIRSLTIYPPLRVDIEITIGVNESIGKARKVMLSVVEGDERFHNEKKPSVIVTELGDYYTKLRFMVWLKESKQHIRVAAELREALKNALDKAEIEMPFETLEVRTRRLRSPQEEAELTQYDATKTVNVPAAQGDIDNLPTK